MGYILSNQPFCIEILAMSPLLFNSTPTKSSLGQAIESFFLWRYSNANPKKKDPMFLADIRYRYKKKLILHLHPSIMAMKSNRI